MKIYTATHPLEAHMLMQLLHQQGIACELRGEMLFALRGEIPMDSSSAPSLWLQKPEQQTAAQQIIREFLNPPPANAGNAQSVGSIMKGNFPPAGSVVLAKPLSEGLTDLALDKLDRTLIKQLRLLDITYMTAVWDFIQLTLCVERHHLFHRMDEHVVLLSHQI